MSAHSDKEARKEKRENVKWWFDIIGISVAAIGVVLVFLQLREMQRSRILDERAWVSAYGLTDKTNANQISFTLSIKNTGKTPALKVTEWHNISDVIPDVFTNAEPIPSSGIIAPDQVVYITASLKAGDGDLWKQFNHSYFFFGKINYDDIFGKPHWTEFCLKITPDLISFPAPVHNACDDAQEGWLYFEVIVAIVLAFFFF